MALQIEFTDKYGITHKECYCKIKTIYSKYIEEDNEGEKIKSNLAVIDVDCYHNKEARTNLCIPIHFVKGKNLKFSEIDIKDLRAEAYTFLKTLSIFAKSTDC